MAGNYAIRDMTPEAWEELQSDCAPYQAALQAGDEQNAKLWYLKVTKSGQGSGSKSEDAYLATYDHVLEIHYYPLKPSICQASFWAQLRQLHVQRPTRRQALPLIT